MALAYLRCSLCYRLPDLRQRIAVQRNFEFGLRFIIGVQVPNKPLIRLVLQFLLCSHRIECDLQLHLLLIDLLMFIRVWIAGFEVNERHPRRIILSNNVDRAGDERSSVAIFVFDERLEFLLRFKSNRCHLEA